MKKNNSKNEKRQPRALPSPVLAQVAGGLEAKDGKKHFEIDPD